jgi:hypothetical protein
MHRIRFTLAVLAIAVAAPAVAAEGPDEQKAEQIAVQLRDSGRMRNYSVGVKYHAGTVWLSGRVASNEQMNAALEVVSDAGGVTKIVNNMTVSGGSASLQQPLGRKTGRAASSPYARPASANSAWDGVQAVQPTPEGRPMAPASMMAPAPSAAPAAGHAPAASAVPVHEDSQLTPAGYHRLAARKAARHACPPTMYQPAGGGALPPAYDQPYLPNYAWPSYAAYPNYAALTYPQQYSPTAWPYIGPFYPYPQVPLGWRKVALEWDDGWWFLDFYDRSHH